MVSYYKKLNMQKVQRQIDLVKLQEIKSQIKMHQIAIINLKQELFNLDVNRGIDRKGNRNMNLDLNKSIMKGGIFE
jgi:hypothetical protein